MEHLVISALLESLKFLIHLAAGEMLLRLSLRKKEKALLASVKSCEQRLGKLEEIVQRKLID
jgi:hypothetical protein